MVIYYLQLEEAIQAEKRRHIRELEDLETRLKESFVMVIFSIDSIL
jgi:hypothetical protein